MAEKAFDTVSGKSRALASVILDLCGVRCLGLILFYGFGGLGPVRRFSLKWHHYNAPSFRTVFVIWGRLAKLGDHDECPFEEEGCAPRVPHLEEVPCASAGVAWMDLEPIYPTLNLIIIYYSTQARGSYCSEHFGRQVEA